MAMRNRSPETGQVLIVVATAFFFVLVGTAAMTIDLGNGMLQQRRLQNVTDAAAVAAVAELSRGSTPGTAVTVARDVISSNTNGAVTLPATNTYSPNTGQPVDLVSGIVITTGPNGSEVRVALQRPVKTYLAGIIGVKTMNVGARSRAGTSYQGLLPLAVKRFSDGDTSIPLSDSNTDPNPSDGSAFDYLTVAGSNPLLNWPSPLSASANGDQLSPNGTGIAATDPGTDPANVCKVGVAGPVFPLTGRYALANVANGNDFHFWIAPDIRNITAASPQYYNNVQSLTSAQQLKNQESTYFISGYPSAPPAVGDQVAAFSGTNDKNSVQLMQQTYPRGAYIGAMLYDGTVYRKSDFQLSVSPAVSLPVNAMSAGGSVQYNITIVPLNGFNDPVNLAVNGPSHWSAVLDQTTINPGQTAHLTVYPDSTITGTPPATFSGTATFEVVGVAPQVVKAEEATVAAGNNKYYSVTSQDPYQAVSQGSYTQYNLGLVGWNSYAGYVTMSGYGWVGSGPSPMDVSVSLDTSTAQVKNKKPGSLVVGVNVVNPNAPTGRYTMWVTVNDGTDTHYIYLTLEIIPPTTSTNITNTTGYIKILGYAKFQVTYYGNAMTAGSKDNNTIYGCAVSDIMSDPKPLIEGMTPRLLPWRYP